MFLTLLLLICYIDLNKPDQFQVIFQNIDKQPKKYINI